MKAPYSLLCFYARPPVHSHTLSECSLEIWGLFLFESRLKAVVVRGGSTNCPRLRNNPSAVIDFG